MVNRYRTPIHSLSLRKSQLLESLRIGRQFLSFLIAIAITKMSFASLVDINKNLEQSLRLDQKTYNQIEKAYDQAIENTKMPKNKKQFKDLGSIQLLKAKIEIQKRALIKLGSESLSLKNWQINLQKHFKDLLKQERQFKDTNKNIESGLVALIELLDSPNLSPKKYFLLTRKSLSYSKTNLANQLRNYDYSHSEGGVMVRPQSEKFNVGAHIEDQHSPPQAPLSRGLSSLKKPKEFKFKNLFLPFRHGSKKKNTHKKTKN